MEASAAFFMPKRLRRNKIMIIFACMVGAGLGNHFPVLGKQSIYSKIGRCANCGMGKGENGLDNGNVCLRGMAGYMADDSGNFAASCLSQTKRPFTISSHPQTREVAAGRPRHGGFLSGYLGRGQFLVFRGWRAGASQPGRCLQRDGDVFAGILG